MLDKSYSNKSIIRVAVPIMLGNLAQTIIIFVDTVFMGHVGTVELGAVMMAGMYYFVFSNLALGFAVGIQIVIARRLGENDLSRIGHVFNHGLIVVLALSILLFTLLHFSIDTLLYSVIESPDIRMAAVKFMEYRHYGIIFVCFNFLFRALYIGLSNTKVITYTTLLMAVVTIVLDYLLIFGRFGFPELGIQGAAIASVCAELSALIFFIVYTFTRLSIKQYGIFSFQRWDFPLIVSIIKISFPTMLQRLVSFGIWFVFFILIEQNGELAIAISGIVRSVYSLILIPVFAFAATANTFTSRLIGEGKSNDVLLILRRILKLTLLIMSILIIFCAAIPEQLAFLYTDDVLLARASVPALYVICGSAITMCFASILFEALSGTGNTMTAFIIESSILVIYVFYILLVTKIIPQPIEIIWCAEFVYSICLAIVSFLYLKYAHWQKKLI